MLQEPGIERLIDEQEYEMRANPVKVLWRAAEGESTHLLLIDK